MRSLTLALALCCSPPSPYENQDRALELIERVWLEDNWGDLPPVLPLWYPDECLPDPWRYDWDPERDEFSLSSDRLCWNGKTLFLGPLGCVIAVRMRGELIADTSFAHEAMHCVGPDPFHQDLARWDYTVPRANELLREQGL